MDRSDTYIFSNDFICCELGDEKFVLLSIDNGIIDLSSIKFISTSLAIVIIEFSKRRFKDQDVIDFLMKMYPDVQSTCLWQDWGILKDSLINMEILIVS